MFFSFQIVRNRYVDQEKTEVVVFLLFPQWPTVVDETLQVLRWIKIGFVAWIIEFSASYVLKTHWRAAFSCPYYIVYSIFFNDVLQDDKTWWLMLIKTIFHLIYWRNHARTVPVSKVIKRLVHAYNLTSDLNSISDLLAFSFPQMYVIVFKRLTYSLTYLSSQYLIRNGWYLLYNKKHENSWK